MTGQIFILNIPSLFISFFYPINQSFIMKPPLNKRNANRLTLIVIESIIRNMPQRITTTPECVK